MKYWILSKDYKRNSTNWSICLISPHRQPFIGRILPFLANIYDKNMVVMAPSHSNNLKESARVIKWLFLSKNIKKVSNNPLISYPSLAVFCHFWPTFTIKIWLSWLHNILITLKIQVVSLNGGFYPKILKE